MFGGSGKLQGIVPRTAETIFENLGNRDAKRFSQIIRLGMIEVYKNDLVDLFASGCKSKLEIRRDLRSGDVSIDNAEERIVQTRDQLLSAIQAGFERRTTASTLLNSDSSRSHLFLTINIEVIDKETNMAVSSKIRLGDLAGSERPKKSGASGEFMKEAIEINKALTALCDVIETLKKGRNDVVVPYRNHKLTQLLSDSLGGSAKMLMVVNISPARSEVDETLSSLAYASRARAITNEKRTGRSRAVVSGRS